MTSESIERELLGWINNYERCRDEMSWINNSVLAASVECRERETHRCQIWKRMFRHSGPFPLFILSNFRCWWRCCCCCCCCCCWAPDRSWPMGSQRLFSPSTVVLNSSTQSGNEVKRVVSSLCNIQSSLAFQLSRFTGHSVPISFDLNSIAS